MRDKAPLLYENVQKRALAGIGGRANAIKCACLQCQGWKKAEVSDCRITDCALWRFRPYQVKAGQKKGGLEE